MIDKNEQTLRIEIQESAEPIPSWSSLCKTPEVLLKEMASRLVTVGRLQDSNIIISDKIPSSSDRKKIWIKTSFPYGIGYVIGGSYRMDYGMSGMVPNTPFLHKVFDPTPGNVRILSESELENYGIKDTSLEAPNRMRWYIFEPIEISY